MNRAEAVVLVQRIMDAVYASGEVVASWLDRNGLAVSLLRDGVPDAPAPQVLTAGAIAVALVRRKAIGLPA